MEIYTDGGCIENPGGIGAWAFVVVANGQVVHKDSGAELVTTNNRTELQAIIEAMRWASRNGVETATFKTDSDLTVKCGTGKWKRKKNLDLWAEFFAVRKDGFALQWLRGHNGNRWNEMADAMCTDEMRKLSAARALPTEASARAFLTA